MDWLTAWQIPIGPAAKALFDWLMNWKPAFTAFRDVVKSAIGTLSGALQALPIDMCLIALLILGLALTGRLRRALPSKTLGYRIQS